VIVISESLKSALLSADVTARAYITLGGMHISDTDNLVSIDLNDEIYNSETDAFVGTFIGKYGEVRILNPDRRYNLENQKIIIYEGSHTIDGVPEYVSMGEYHCYEVLNEETGITTIAKIMDNKILFNIDFDVNAIVYPATLREIASKACTQAGVALSTKDFPNEDYLVESSPFPVGTSCADVIKYIAGAAGSFAKINTAGELEFKWFSENVLTISPENYFSCKDHDIFGPINSVVLSRDPQNDNVYLLDEASVAENGLCELKISNNVVVDDNREGAVPAIFTRVNGFSYRPCELQQQGCPFLEAGDRLLIIKMDGTAFETVIMQHKLSFDGALISNIDAPALTRTQIDYSSAGSLEKRVRDAEIKVDKVEGSILMQVSEQYATTDTLNAAIEQTDAALKDALANYALSGDLENLKTEISSQLTLLADQMTLKFSETNGRIADVDGDLQAKYNTITTYFTFEIDGLTIGKIDNPYKVVLDNDRYSMFANNVEVLWLDATTQEVHTPRLTITELFNLLGYVEEKDEAGNVNCIYVG